MFRINTMTVNTVSEALLSFLLGQNQQNDWEYRLRGHAAGGSWPTDLPAFQFFFNTPSFTSVSVQ